MLTMSGHVSVAATGAYQIDGRFSLVITEPATTNSSTRGSGRRPNAISEIDSNTTIGKNHPVLLSLNTLEGRNYLIVVEIR
jgi:hypothetical protein